MQLFNDVALCKQFSENVIRDANIRHKRDGNYKQLLEIYDEISKGE